MTRYGKPESIKSHGQSKVNDATLTLKPGVIMFDEGTSLGIGTKSGVTNAKLIAEGTASQSNSFTANSSNPVKGYYLGLLFGAGDNGSSCRSGVAKTPQF